MREAPESDGRFFKVPKVIEKHCEKVKSEKMNGTLLEKPKTLAELRAGVESGRTKATGLAESYYVRIAEVNPRLNAYLSLSKERAMEQAGRIDAMAAKGDPLPPLAGVPCAIKDVMVMKGARATPLSKIFEGYLPP